MSDTLAQSRGATLLAGEFSEFAADLAADVAKENPDFSTGYIDQLVTAWADWATLVADEPLAGYALTVDMDEVWHAALRRTRKNFSFMSRLTGGRFIHHEPADTYGSPRITSPDSHLDTAAASAPRTAPSRSTARGVCSYRTRWPLRVRVIRPEL